ncbi:MAG: hypothetical protein GF364_07070 [Candidatus Lokiarchaeota archaeon]|nr:hypothetical protein [Candidatus Lokiarchaeota archaeon]
MKNITIVRKHNGDTSLDSFLIFPKKETFKILQVTDMHYHGMNFRDKKELKELRKFCEKSHVDFVINTGDMFGNRGIRRIKRIMSAFDRYIGSYCPWTFAWGNHDCENFRKRDFFRKFNKIEQFLEDLPNCYYIKTHKFFEEKIRNNNNQDQIEKVAFFDPMQRVVSWQKFDGFYGGNFLFKVQNTHNTAIAWNIFILNSRRWYSLPNVIVQWMQDQVSKQENQIPSLAFYHVPNLAYKRIWDRKIAHGIKRESVCYEKEDGRIHTMFKKLRVIKGCFVGHDHVNDYYGEIDGIVYGYGRKTGRRGYGSGTNVKEPVEVGKKIIQIGAKLITIYLDNDHALKNRWEHVTVFSDGLTWKTKKMITW